MFTYSPFSATLRDSSFRIVESGPYVSSDRPQWLTRMAVAESLLRGDHEEYEASPTMFGGGMPDTVRRQREFALDRLVAARASGSAGGVRRAEQLVVIAHLEFADALAARYRGRGLDLDDLRQIARLALMQAIGRWDPEAGEFLGFAAPTITGSIKRHFRDQLYLVRIPRGLQEINREADAAQTRLRERNPTHPPTAQDIATSIDRSVDDLAQARLARASTHIQDVDAAQCADEDTPFERVEARVDLRVAIRRLDRDERRLLNLYYFKAWSQSRIADMMGVSQMQVSRVHAQIIRKLRRSVAAAS